VEKYAKIIFSPKLKLSRSVTIEGKSTYENDIEDHHPMRRKIWKSNSYNASFKGIIQSKVGQV
jgi:hypothetical protein